jgi:hypothetical protein
LEYNYLLARKAAIKLKPLSVNHITELFWEKVLENGRPYCPPLSIVAETESWIPTKPVLQTGQHMMCRGEDPLRLYFITLQKAGYLKGLNFWTPGKIRDRSEALYRLSCLPEIPGNARSTPLSLMFGLIMGEEAWDKFILYLEKWYGCIKFRPPDGLRDLVKSIWGIDDVDTQIFVDHTSQLIFPLEDMGEFSTEDEVFRIQRLFLDKINDLSRSLEKEDTVAPTFSTWEDLQNEVCPAVVSQNQNLGITSDQTINEKLNEDAEILKALVAQVFHPTIIHAEEQIMRSDLMFQIYGTRDDADDESSEGDVGFGDMW